MSGGRVGCVPGVYAWWCVCICMSNLHLFPAAFASPYTLSCACRHTGHSADDVQERDVLKAERGLGQRQSEADRGQQGVGLQLGDQRSGELRREYLSEGWRWSLQECSLRLIHITLQIHLSGALTQRSHVGCIYQGVSHGGCAQPSSVASSVCAVSTQQQSGIGMNMFRLYWATYSPAFWTPLCVLLHWAQA